MIKHREHRFLLVVLLFLTTTAATCRQLPPAQRVVVAIDAADAIYLPARSWANAERDAGRLTEERFQQIAVLAEGLRVARESAVDALASYMRLPLEARDSSLLLTVLAGLESAYDRLDKEVPVGNH